MSRRFSADFPDVANACMDAMFAATDGTKASMIAAGAFLWLTVLWNACEGDSQMIMACITDWVSRMKDTIDSGEINEMFNDSEPEPQHTVQ